MTSASIFLHDEVDLLLSEVSAKLGLDPIELWFCEGTGLAAYVFLYHPWNSLSFQILAMSFNPWEEIRFVTRELKSVGTFKFHFFILFSSFLCSCSLSFFFLLFHCSIWWFWRCLGWSFSFYTIENIEKSTKSFLKFILIWQAKPEQPSHCSLFDHIVNSKNRSLLTVRFSLRVVQGEIMTTIRAANTVIGVSLSWRSSF